MPIPKIIHFTIPAHASPLQQAAIETAKRLHPEWKIMVWQDPILRDEFRLSKYWREAKSGAQLADLIRIEAVMNHGGIYLDSDVILHRRLDEIAENYDFFIASEDGIVATNAVFGSTIAHPALSKMVDDLDNNPPDWSCPPNVTTGPCFFSKILKWRKDVTILPRETFYPYNWNERISKPHPSTYGTHQWDASWVPNRAKPTFLSKLCKYANPIRLVLDLTRKIQRWIRSNERSIKLLSSKVNAYPIAEKIIRKTIHGHSIILSGKDFSITPEIVYRGYYELREELFIKQILRGGDFFIDVGANVGTFSLLAASIVGPFGRVYAYEPNPVVVEMLKNSATMNWVHERLIVSSCAVGDAPGNAVLRFNPSRIGDATLVDIKRAGTYAQTASYLGESTSVSTPVITLDSEFPCDLPIKFLKIDAEGYETSVLKGAERLLSRQCIDYVMLETVQEVAGESWEELLESIKNVCAHGYATYTLGPNGGPVAIELEAIRNGQRLQTRNIVLMSSFAVEKFSCQAR